MRDPITNLSEESIIKEPRLTQSVVSAWICRMIDAGWNLAFRPEIMFYHADHHAAVIRHHEAEKLASIYWKTLIIPTPHDYKEILCIEPRRLTEAKPLGWPPANY